MAALYASNVAVRVRVPVDAPYNKQREGGKMKVCVGCIKQDVCKYRDDVKMQEEFDAVVEHTLREPLEVVVDCKYRQGCVETVSCWDEGDDWATYTDTKAYTS